MPKLGSNHHLTSLPVTPMQTHRPINIVCSATGTTARLDAAVEEQQTRILLNRLAEAATPESREHCLVVLNTVKALIDLYTL